MSYEELVKGLREHAERFNYDGWIDTAIWFEKASDAIEELQKDLDRSKEYETFWQKEATEALKKFQVAVASKPRWIPVTERLPEDNLAVLVTYIGYNSHKQQADMLAYRYDGEWLWVEDATSYAPLGTVECAVPITHWMPLPEPPKEETMFYPQVDGITPCVISPKEDEA